ncbi:MAG: Uma2 family endonuclease, partial [Gammaproteobacteria bacterium]|nr:Uma2 family endonuclease [Gammaproteobacteria bacterium]
DRNDVYIGGNMFVYFDPEQRKKHNFCGPDFFVVKGAAGKHWRDSWVLWEEDWLAPNFVVELASPSTAEFDLDGKKDIYEQKLKTPEYVIYDPATKTLSGWRLLGGRYVAIPLDAKGRLWSRELGLWLGIAEHSVLRRASKAKFLRFFDRDGSLLPTEKEAEAQRADTAEEQLDVEKRRADAAEAEIARLRALWEK